MNKQRKATDISFKDYSPGHVAILVNGVQAGDIDLGIDWFGETGTKWETCRWIETFYNVRFEHEDLETVKQEVIKQYVANVPPANKRPHVEYGEW